MRYGAEIQLYLLGKGKGMDIVLVFNGLGNQMSQYAFYLAKKKVNKDTKCFFYNSDASHNGYELEKLFGIKLEKNVFLIHLFKFLSNRNIFIRCIKKILQYARIVEIKRENFNYHFDEKNLSKGKALITFYWGGWHSYKYIDLVKDEILSLYKFKENMINEINRDISLEMKNTNSVSIHVRRGDYLKKCNSLWGGVVNEGFYNKVFQQIVDIENKQFYFFTDDPSWVKENFKLPNMRVMDINVGEDSWLDMYLMSNCKININPNSTFSWWASWLNPNENKIVYVPDRFVITNKEIDFYPKQWIKIERGDEQ